MTARFRIVAPAAALLAFAQLPALAQYANEFVPAKLITQGKTSTSIAGNGTVVVQVQVNPDGTHKAIKVIHSTNPGDNAAAMDIAQSSTYRPAHRGSTPVTSFYDYTLKFNGKLVVNASEQGPSVPSGGGAVSPAASQVAALIRAGQYAQAKSKAEAGLLSSPNDESLREMLGLAAYHAGDYTTAAAAFDKVANVGPQFKPTAADSLATASVKETQTDPTQALAYAQKAVALQPNANSHFALGVAQLANGDAAGAVQSLKVASAAATSDPKIPVRDKVNIDAQLLQADLANHDTAGAQAVAAQIKQLDPNSTAGAQAMGVSLVKSARAARDAKDTATALSDYDQAAALGDPSIAVTADTEAAFTIAGSSKPDYKRMQAYAEKALALKPNDAAANFADGIALTGQWAANHDDATKKKAADALDKADQQAKAAGDEALSLQIETFIKKNLNAASSGQSGGGG
ncbi:MAG: tetratricopeptide repeat protein [Candidatus Eremiobacteraeota bacterium]|nr:tetratricopeptide repeat protein [Candidatus Eremiobacteraeota bacterium]